MPKPSNTEPLADQRAAAGLTQQQCADLLGVGRVTWSRWESGVQHMPPYALRLWRHLAGLEAIPFRLQHTGVLHTGRRGRPQKHLS